MRASNKKMKSFKEVEPLEGKLKRSECGVGIIEAQEGGSRVNCCHGDAEYM